MTDADQIIGALGLVAGALVLTVAALVTKCPESFAVRRETGNE